MQTFTVKTKSRSDLADVTNEVSDAVRRFGLKHGAVLVFVPHTTAGVTINENADPSVRRDLVAILDRLIPWEAGYEHGEGNSAAHAKSSLVGSSVTVPVENGA
ncbi:MAG: secondary thiamine-phosphate synthase enzyme YjbQ, partial [Planctomycetota bacterium]